MVVVTQAKMLYFELMKMLAALNISHDHLDPLPNACVRDDGSATSGQRQRAANRRREGLRNLRRGSAQVLVLNLVVRMCCPALALPA